MDEAVYRKALEKVNPWYREAFEKFVNTGEANLQFLDYLDKDKNAQDAFDMLFPSGANKLEDKVREFLKEKHPD